MRILAFAALALVVGVPAAGADMIGTEAFKTPSGNIVCAYTYGRGVKPDVFCGIHSGLKPAPPRVKCEEGHYAGDRVYLTETGRVGVPKCAGDPGPFVFQKRAKVLRYGQTWRRGGVRCASTIAGLTCRNKRGHGFFLSRARWRRF